MSFRFAVGHSINTIRVYGSRNMVQQFNLSHVWQLEINCQNKVRDMESRLWLQFRSGHPNMYVAQACLENVSPPKFWSLADLYLDLVSRLHIQVRLMGNLCLNGGMPWLFNTEGSLCFIAKNTQKRYITTLLIVSLLGIVIALCGLT